MLVLMQRITEDPERFLAECARVSRRGDCRQDCKDKDRATISRLIRDGHESVLEHASATFLIEGISRCCMAQLLRHRHLSATVESQRYCDMSGLSLKDMVYPETVEESTAWEEADEAVGACLEAYQALIKAGVPLEDARYFLPQASPTRLVVTANFREWRHIIKLRTAPEAQWEIRKLVGKIQDILVKHAPSVFGGNDEAGDG